MGYFKLTTATSLTAQTRTLRIRIFVNDFIFYVLVGRFTFSFMILKLKILTADFSRNSFMYSNTFESYNFNYVTDH